MKAEEHQAENRIIWGQICIEAYPLLKRHARGLVNGNPYDIEDLVQDTVIRILRYGKDPNSIENQRMYLLRMMQNIWHDKRVQNARFGRLVSLDETLSEETEAQLPVIEPTALRLLENLELVEQLNLNAGPLDQHERMLLQLHLEGRSNSEIAKSLSVDIQVVRCDLNAILAKVRYRLKSKAIGRRSAD